ncbi:hypothetical protein [Flavobacterium panacagri]|uniref:hypothetical protein n=1 Tax=Flavobacterium panacagri TaxID=3034146 RepID=UPI0025A4E2B2|nr:hypothetical protein [Flavobacterium panacagri]
MSFKIIANNIEIDFVKETLTVKNENNLLSRDFKVSASAYPFLIIENRRTQLALGTRDLASIKKKKIIQVIVFDGSEKFYGELQILSYLKGFRKCNLRFSSVLLSIMSRKISEFMPIISIIPNETDPVPFSEKSAVALSGSEYWKTYPRSFLDKNYPEVKWQFPSMKWFNKFGVGLESDDPWSEYQNHINLYDSEGLVENYYTIVSNVCTVYNKNVVAPQVFLLSPVFYALESLGFTLKGSFPNSDFIKRLLLYSNKNNLTETSPAINTETLGPPQTLNDIYIWDDDGHGESHIVFTYAKLVTVIPATVEGTYVFSYEMTVPTFEINLPVSFIPFVALEIYLDGKFMRQVDHVSGQVGQMYSGSVAIEVEEEDLGKNININYYTPNTIPYNATIVKNAVYSKLYYQMHPTIQLGRYVPDWTFGTLLNELQNLFNLEIIPDDFTKTLTINLNESTIKKSNTYQVKKSLLLSSYDPPKYNAFLLKYDNEIDEAIWVTAESVELFEVQKSDFSETLNSKFKFVPVTYTADLSEDLDSKNGTGIMIYDPAKMPYISSDYLGQTLKISGAKGIYEVFWKVFIKFMLNSSIVELWGPFTETEKNKLLKCKRIFVDNQEYVIATSEITETQQNNYKIKFSLNTVSF